ncbi:MAG: hypothetical protein AAFR44_04515, partial [Pseudomonadota bacterium]
MSADHLTPSVSAAYHGAVIATIAGGVAIVGGIWSLGTARAASTEPTPLTASSVTAPSVTAIDTVSAIAPPEAWYAADFAVPDRKIERADGTLKRRETLADLLTGLGASPSDAYAALKPLFDGELLDPRRLRPGLEAELTFEETGADEPALIGLSIRTADDHSLFVERLDDGRFEAAKLSTKLFASHKRVNETIEYTLYEAALSAGAQDQQVADFAQIFAYDVDFQREIQPGDTFEIVYEAFVDERG